MARSCLCVDLTHALPQEFDLSGPRRLLFIEHKTLQGAESLGICSADVVLSRKLRLVGQNMHGVFPWNRPHLETSGNDFCTKFRLDGA